MIRHPQVAHQFYPGEPAALERKIKGFLRKGEEGVEGAEGLEKPVDAVAVIAPHAGYVYSGKVAGCVFSKVKIPDNVILIGPNHTGFGERASIMCSGTWEIPTGKVEINEALARAILASSPLFLDDSLAHMGEHSLEVELPFIHYLNPKARIVPITVMPADIKKCSEMGKAVAGAVSACNEPVLIVVSSDMNHYEPDDVTREKDQTAIERALALDAGGLLSVTSKKGITMCGVVPATIGIVAAKELGAEGARLEGYATSADAGGDYDHVVGYAGIVVK